MTHLRVGDVLRRKRLDAGLTQKELAALVDYNHTSVSRVEWGEQHPSQQYLTRCIEALRVPESEQGELWKRFRMDSGLMDAPYYMSLSSPNHLIPYWNAVAAVTSLKV